MVGNPMIVSAKALAARGVDLPYDEIVDFLNVRVAAGVAAGIPWQPGARELLEAVHAAGIPMALVTSSFAVLADPFAAAVGLFDAVVSGDEVSRPKPDPEPYLLAAQRLGCRRRRRASRSRTPGRASPRRSRRARGRSRSRCTRPVAPRPGPEPGRVARGRVARGPAAGRRGRRARPARGRLTPGQAGQSGTTPIDRSTAPAGTSGGVPPNAGHSALNEHQSHSFDGRGRQSPDSGGVLDAAPDRPHARLDRGHLRLGRLVREDHAVAEVLQLQPLGQDPARAPDDVGVEPHLEERRALEPCTRRPAGLVVDHPHPAVRCDVDPVDDPAQLRTVLVQLGGHHQLALARFQTGRVLEREVRRQERLGARQPLGQVRGSANSSPIDGSRSRSISHWTGRSAWAASTVRSRAGRSNRCSSTACTQRAAGGGRARRLGQPVDHAEPEQLRALQEVVRPRRRQTGP